MVRSGETIDLGGAARPARRRQALDRRRGRQDDARRRADRRGVRRAVREDERPRARPHRRHARQARVDPRLRVELTTEEFIEQVREIGLAIVGQTGDLVPADKKLYALRDVTATVDNVSLIAASIMSKKIAAGRRRDRARREGRRRRVHEDARRTRRCSPRRCSTLGQRAGRDVVCVLTDMDQPLGRAVGNALEVREAVRHRPRRAGRRTSPSSCSTACAHLLALSDLGIDGAEARRRAEAAVADGSAVRRLRALGARAGRRPGRRTRCRRRRVVARGVRPAGRLRARGSARIAVGVAALHLGAGRREKDDAIDHAVGVVCRKKRGDAVAQGEPLAEIHARDEASAAEAAADVLAAFELGDERRGARRSCSTRISAVRGIPARVASVMQCPSCPRSRPSARGSSPCSTGGGSSTSRSTTRGSCVRTTRPRSRPSSSGERVAAVERRGKYLIVRFESGRALLIHLRMTGSLRHCAAGARRRPAPQRCCQARRRIGRRATATCAASAPGSCSSRASCEPYLATTARRGAARRGASPPPASARASRSAARRSRRRSSTSARSPGLGNIYVDEALWRARIHPLRPAESIDRNELRRLHRRDPRGARARHRAAGLDAPRLPAARRRQRRDAERVQGLRPRRRAVRPLRHADREVTRRRPRHVVLPDVPAGAPQAASELVEPAVAVEAPELGVAADRRRRRSGSAAPSSRPSGRGAAAGRRDRRRARSPRRRAPSRRAAPSRGRSSRTSASYRSESGPSSLTNA